MKALAYFAYFATIDNNNYSMNWAQPGSKTNASYVYFLNIEFVFS